MKPGTRIEIVWLLAAMLLTAGARGQSPVIVRVDAHANGPAIPDDFCGLSFESSNLLPDKRGKYLFSGDDTDLIRLFRTIGIKNLRVGGGTADGPEFAVPSPADIDHLFSFANAADVKIIYTLRLLNGDVKHNADLARYIMQHYAARLVCFEIGNEPDWHSFHTSPRHPRDPRIFETVPGQPGTAFPSYLSDWNQYAGAIASAAPGARFTGPDTGSNYPVPGTKETDSEGQSWTWHFARAQRNSGRLLFVTQHDYPGQSATGVSPAVAINPMCSKEWVQKRYPLLFDHVLGPVQKVGIYYRMTEANDYTGGVDGASNAFASALWALDYLHWHAAQHAVGVNFHNKRWIYTDTIVPDRSGKLRFNPKAYAIRAFELGAKGIPNPVSIENRGGVNLTAYAVRNGATLSITLINKEHGVGAKQATVTIHAPGIWGLAAGMFLQAPGGDPGARAGITLGGAKMSNDSWDGRWSDLKPCQRDETTVMVPPASAVMMRLSVK